MSIASEVGRPTSEEFAPFYAGYVAAVPERDPITLLGEQVAETQHFCEQLGEAAAGAPYAPGKWTVKDVLCHLADTERVMAYRALCIARGDTTPLPGFDQDDYVRAAGAANRPLARLLAELVATRVATVALFQSLDAAAFERRGTANTHTVSVRALLHIILGHERHHLRILREHLGATVGAEGGTH
ncbi:MAG TPA: DinB family protein [Gemmatimonadaceae bacterium]|nr:DinB family protein [Gemmatimonadaceae bacterium]